MDMRTNKRTRLRLECQLELKRGQMLRGYTNSVSTDDVEFQSSGLNRPGCAERMSGEVGVFSLRYRKGPQNEALKISARVVYIRGPVVGLSLSTMGLPPQQRSDFVRILESGSLHIA